MSNAPDDLQQILEYQLIPCWERYGLERLVISEPTLRRFQAQELPPMMRVSVKRRQSKKVRSRGPRVYNNVATVSEAFPADAQDTCRHPILYCVVKGHADLHIADYLVHCPAGHFVLMRPGVSQPDGKRPHLEGANSDGYCEILHLSLLPGAAGVAAWICCSQAGKHRSYHHCGITRPDVVHQLSFFMREMLDGQPGYQKTATNSLHNFLLLLLRELKAGHLQPALADGAPQTLAMNEDLMEFARQYMESHLHQHLTSAKVAEAVFMSRSNFLRHFSRATGQSFNQYLTSLRLEKAREFLASGNFSVQAASDKVGLQPAQLYRIFKTHLKLSPSEYKQLKK
jgi:AraC-like DNA-binding protein